VEHHKFKSIGSALAFPLVGATSGWADRRKKQTKTFL
jgi:hypothetical protein